MSEKKNPNSRTWASARSTSPPVCCCCTVYSHSTTVYCICTRPNFSVLPSMWPPSVPTLAQAHCKPYATSTQLREIHTSASECVFIQTWIHTLGRLRATKRGTSPKQHLEGHVCVCDCAQGNIKGACACAYMCSGGDLNVTADTGVFVCICVLCCPPKIAL